MGREHATPTVALLHTPFSCAFRHREKAQTRNYYIKAHMTMASRAKNSSWTCCPSSWRGKHLGRRLREAGHGYNTMLGKTCINKATISLSLIIYLIYCVPGKYCMKKSICWLLYSH